jgi:serine/threonine protein phosphatase PrpC
VTISGSVKVESYGASRRRTGPGSSRDAFWIARAGAPAAVVCDGTGPAPQCAGRVVRLFAQQVEAGTLDVSRFPSWTQWLAATDASLAGGAETTFAGVAVVGDRVVGACAGDSQVFLVNEHGCVSLGHGTSPRLGTGAVAPVPVHHPLAAHDVVLLMSDGAWGVLPPAVIQSTVAQFTLKHLADLPPALLDRAAAHGHADDMTIVALRAGS